MLIGFFIRNKKGFAFNIIFLKHIPCRKSKKENRLCFYG